MSLTASEGRDIQQASAFGFRVYDNEFTDVNIARQQEVIRPAAAVTPEFRQTAATQGRYQRLQTVCIRDVPDIRFRFRLAGYPAFFSNPVPVSAKMVPGTGYLSRIVFGPFWQ